MAVAKALTSQNCNFYEETPVSTKTVHTAVALCVRVYRWFLVPEVLSGDGTDPSGSKQRKVFQKFVTLL